jgi:hypothetical protein
VRLYGPVPERAKHVEIADDGLPIIRRAGGSTKLSVEDVRRTIDEQRSKAPPAV